MEFPSISSPPRPARPAPQTIVPPGRRLRGGWWETPRIAPRAPLARAERSGSCPSRTTIAHASVTASGGGFGVITGKRSWSPSRRAAHSCARRANQARRLARRANQGPQLHERLVECPRSDRGHQPLGRLPDARLRRRGLEIVLDRQQPRQDALTVGLDDRLGSIERKREDRPGNIAAHSRQSPHRGRVVRGSCRHTHARSSARPHGAACARR